MVLRVHAGEPGGSDGCWREGVGVRMYRKIKNRLKRQWAIWKSPKVESSVSLQDNAFFRLMALPGKVGVPTAEEVDRYYGAKIRSNWLQPPRRLVDIQLDLEEIPDEALIERANEVLEFRLSPAGLQPRVRGGRILWAEYPSSDIEKNLTLNRHAWWVLLGVAYRKSGDERYAEAFVQQMTDWIDANPMPRVKTESSPVWRLMETGMRMRVSWIPAFALFYDAAAFTRQAKMKMLRSIHDHAVFLSTFHTNRNHLIRESNGLVAVSVYFNEFRDSEQWLASALERLETELRTQVNEDGSHIEVSTGYQWLVIDEYEQLFEMLSANGLDLPHEHLKGWLERMYGVLSRLVRPDRSIPEINDGFIHWQSDRIEAAGALLGRDDLTYIGSKGRTGTPPDDTSVRFPNAGLYVMRSDWSMEGHYLLFDAAPFGGPHGHEDRLSLEVSAFGKPFIVDCGSFSYDRKNPYRTYFVGSYAHNTVLVDGKSQIRRWDDANLTPHVGVPEAADWYTDGNFDFVSAVYAEGYGDYAMQRPENPGIVSGVTHKRSVIFVKPDYWLVVDEMSADGRHTFEHLFHCAPGVTVTVGEGGAARLRAPDGDACLFITPLGGVRATIVNGREVPPQGWFSTGYESKVPIDTLIYTSKGDGRFLRAFVLFPHKGDSAMMEAPAETIMEPLDDGESYGLRIRMSDHTDHIVFSPNDAEKRFGPCITNLAWAVVREDNAGGLAASFER